MLQRLYLMIFGLLLLSACAGDPAATDNAQIKAAADRHAHAQARHQAERQLSRHAEIERAESHSRLVYGTPVPAASRDSFADWEDNPVRQVSENPLSTFSLDVNGASLVLVRGFLNGGRLPPKDAVRTEEIINALVVDHGFEASEQEPVVIGSRIVQTPWNPQTRLLEFALQTWVPGVEQLPRSNLVFLVDVSGSMSGEDRLELIKRGFAAMLTRLHPDDSVAIVSYASGSEIVLPATPVRDRATIFAALEGLRAAGGTHTSDGIQRAYRMAEQAYIEGGNNRVILATDGDINVGLSGQALVAWLERQRDRGIYLTVLGVGQGNYIDSVLEPLARHGNGNYYYLDSFREARRVLVHGVHGTLHAVANDVKLQLEFNPAVVAEYRLIGYNKSQLAAEDFNNDGKDAGELGAGHTVTALYEITLRDGDYRFVDDARYAGAPQQGERVDELALIKLRYKTTQGEASIKRDLVVAASALQSPQSPGLAVAAAGFAEKLRQSPWLAGLSWSELQALVKQMPDSEGRRELADLLDLAQVIGG